MGLTAKGETASEDRSPTIEHDKTRYTIIRRGKAVAFLAPINTGRGSDVKKMLRRHVADKGWSRDLRELRELIEIDVRS